MRDINGEGLGENVVLVADHTKMDDPLDLVLTIIDETLIKQRKMRHFTNHHVPNPHQQPRQRTYGSWISLWRHLCTVVATEGSSVSQPSKWYIYFIIIEKNTNTWVFDSSRKRLQEPSFTHLMTSRFVLGNKPEILVVHRGGKDKIAYISTHSSKVLQW